MDDHKERNDVRVRTSKDILRIENQSETSTYIRTSKSIKKIATRNIFFLNTKHEYIARSSASPLRRQQCLKRTVSISGIKKGLDNFFRPVLGRWQERIPTPVGVDCEAEKPPLATHDIRTAKEQYLRRLGGQFCRLVNAVLFHTYASNESA